MRNTLPLLALAVAAVSLQGCAATHGYPRLIGIGCEGIADPDGVLYADEEDHFPRCKSIEPFDPYPDELDGDPDV